MSTILTLIGYFHIATYQVFKLKQNTKSVSCVALIWCQCTKRAKLVDESPPPPAPSKVFVISSQTYWKKLFDRKLTVLLFTLFSIWVHVESTNYKSSEFATFFNSGQKSMLMLSLGWTKSVSSAQQKKSSLYPKNKHGDQCVLGLITV